MNILEWLGGHDTGLSSKAIALTAMGAMPKQPDYPRDGADFGRCFRLLALCPDAKIGLERLGRDGGTIWEALVARWPEIEAAYLHDLRLTDGGERDRTKFKCYDLLSSIYRPAEDASGRVIRGKGFSIHT